MLRKYLQAFLIIAVLSPCAALAIGSGGVLNHVPQARVWLGEGESKKELVGWDVYVHPTEGSIVVISKGRDECIALDRWKNQTIRMDPRLVTFLSNGIYVEHDIPFKLLLHRPTFTQLSASTRLENGMLFTISVRK